MTCAASSQLEKLLTRPDDKPLVLEFDGVVSLHFDLAVIQSQMCVQEPDQLVLAYTRAMMGFLLFFDTPVDLCLVGLGGGSLAKFCYRHLPDARIDAVEINPDVIALRESFRVPADDDRFKVIAADGAAHIASACEQYDAVLVDGFDEHGQAPSLSTAHFYQRCFDSLKDGGVLVVNLNSCDMLSDLLEARIRQAFSEQSVAVRVPESGNVIVFAIKNRPIWRPRRLLLDRAERLEAWLPIRLKTLSTAIHRAFRKVAEDRPALMLE